MLTLQCLWCDHRNPAGSNFCNGCGTPLYLKPCTHCDAVNQRAAVHCRGCGEAFSFDFVALAEAEALVDEPVPAGVDLQPPSPSRDTRPVRASALAAGLLAAAAVSAFYAYREAPAAPEQFAEANVSHPEPATLAVRALLTPMTLPALSTPLVDRAVSLPIIREDPREKTSARRPRASSRGKAPAPTHATKTRKAAPAVAANRSRAVLGRSVTRHATLMCAEGVALSPACDVRTLAKGN